MKTTTSFFLAIYAFFCIQNVESRVSQCYYVNTEYNQPLQIEDCPNPEVIDYVCISARLESTGMEVKGCIYKGDTDTRSNCDTIQHSDGGHCYLCESNLCNSAKVHSVSVLLLASFCFALSKIFF